MKELTVQDVLPYMQIWTGVILGFLLFMLAYFWRFEKKHPEIFEPDKAADRKWQYGKNELRRQYHNKVMLTFLAVFVWMAGIILIAGGFVLTRLSLAALIVVFLAMVLPIMNMKRKR